MIFCKMKPKAALSKSSQAHMICNADIKHAQIEICYTDKKHVILLPYEEVTYNYLDARISRDPQHIDEYLRLVRDYMQGRLPKSKLPKSKLPKKDK